MLWIPIWSAAIVVGALGLAIGAPAALFARRVRREARELWAQGTFEPPRPLALESLPAPARRYLEVSGAARRPPVRTVRLRHGGTFRIELGKPWLPIRGEQYFCADPPGFVWWGRVRVAPGLRIEARDRSLRGEGNMLVKVAGSWTLADSRGPELDEGALMRLLTEMVWFPTAFLDGRHVSWAEGGEERARVTLRVGGREVTATAHFGPDGLPARFAADRRREVEGKGVLTSWIADCSDYREVGGLRVPFRAAASWEIDGHAEPYALWAIERIEYDRPDPY